MIKEAEKMKETDCVEVIVEKEKYAKEGVHKGMNGWICLESRCSSATWLVNFPQYGAKPDIATIGIEEEDMKVIPVMNAIVNERIKKEFGD
jgi:hypothetical protein